MTTKKFIKEMMFLGISRSHARKLVQWAREDGISNEKAHYVVCTVMGMDIHGVPMEDVHENS